MRHRARSLHVLALAPVAAIFAGVLGPTSHALAAAPKAPAPIVVTVDAGHGGQPSAAHPTTPFDPGAIGTNGLLEKDVDLDVASRLAALLRADLVDVVMTRTSDVHLTASAAPADLGGPPRGAGRQRARQRVDQREGGRGRGDLSGGVEPDVRPDPQ